jgi:hypothetical protein
MHLSKWSYLADFVVYPVWIVAGVAWQLSHLPAHSVGPWCTAVGLGWLAWTVIEYLLHRWVLHHVPPFNRLHLQHHAHPGAWIGTPTWLSAALFVALWAVLDREASALAAGGLATGLMIGYLAYTWVHHAVHHHIAHPGSWLFAAKLRHARHHRAGARSDYGVTSGVWDAVLRTASTLASR